MSTSPRSPAVRRKHLTYRFHLPVLSQKSSCYPLLPPGGNGMLPCLLGARHQNVPFESNVFVILVVPAFPVEFSWYRGAAKDDGILEYVFEGVYMRLLGEKDFSAIANIVLRYWRRHPERNAGSGVARLRKKVIRVA